MGAGGGARIARRPLPILHCRFQGQRWMKRLAATRRGGRSPTMVHAVGAAKCAASHGFLASTYTKWKVRSGILDREAGEIIERRIRTERERFPRCSVKGASEDPIEGIDESEWVARCLEELGHEVVVADPKLRRHVRDAEPQVKTDLARRPHAGRSLRLERIASASDSNRSDT